MCTRISAGRTKKTHKEVSEILKRSYPNIKGLSERSVRRFCEANNIHLRDRKLSTAELDAAVSSAISEGSAIIFYNSNIFCPNAWRNISFVTVTL